MHSHSLKHVREHRHFKVEDVASFAKISLERLRAFEEGTRTPSFKQLETLAEVYGIPSYLLASDALPNLPEVLPDFRRQVPRPARLSPAGMRKVWSAERISCFSHQLISEIKSVGINVGKQVINSISPEVAAGLRQRFDEWFIGNEAYLGLNGKRELVFFSALRIYFEARGLIVNVNDAPSDDYMGFYISPESGVPISFVNRKIYSKKAQLFTLLHEYCHHLIGKEGVSDPFVADNHIERSCNRFAAEFLEPLSHFEKSVKRIGRTSRGDVFSLVNQASAQSLLSKHATAIRLLEAGFISQAQLKSWTQVVQRTPRAEKEDEIEAAGDAFAPPHAKRIGELGYLPTYLAGIAVKRKMIDSIDVQSALGLSEGLQGKAFDLASRRIEVALK